MPICQGKRVAIRILISIHNAAKGRNASIAPDGGDVNVFFVGAQPGEYLVFSHGFFFTRKPRALVGRGAVWAPLGFKGCLGPQSYIYCYGSKSNDQ